MDPSAAHHESVLTLLILMPEWILLLTAVAMMTAGAFVRLPRRVWCATAAIALFAAILGLFVVGNRATDPYAAVALNDAFSYYCRIFLAVTGLILVGLAHDQVDDARSAEYFGSILLIMTGSMLVAAANDLIFLFVGLELVSIPTYLLLYLARRNKTTQEAATKYFFLSIFASGLLLFGMAYLYGLSGLSNLKALAFLADQTQNVPSVPDPQFGLIAVFFIMAGLCFRVAAVPLHFYAPDVYEGSPTIMAALLSWIPKAVGFLAMIRMLTAVFSGAGPGNHLVGQAVILTWILAAATMTLGNTVALLQNNLRRLLAYSSIAHAGYILIGVAAAFNAGAGPGYSILGTQGILFYLAAYAFMTLGVFGLIIALGTPENPVETVDDLSGLAQTRPWAAFGMAICLFSLAGIPPLLGFWGKFQIFWAAVASTANGDPRKFQVLAVIGMLNAAVGAYYYLRIIVGMYLRPATRAIEPRAGWPTVASATACVLLTLFLGIFSKTLTAPCQEAARAAVQLEIPKPAAATNVADSATDR
jgi:NADH-quinone oxidoreductase subunit N